MNKLNLLFSFVIISSIISSCTVSPAKYLAKTNYISTRDEGHDGNAKILTGIINRNLLETDTAFKWFADNYKYAQPTADAIKTFTQANTKEGVNILVFGGTWCHDTQNLLPLFYKLIDKSGFNPTKIFLVGVDRNKTTLKNLHSQYKITNVPTFIILQNFTEVGRVVEYGSLGAIDKELAQIAEKLK